MGKRKASDNQGSDIVAKDLAAMDISAEEEASDGDDNENNEEEMIDIDFDFFDPKEIDYHSIKNLMIQLFSADSELFNLNDLTELIIGQPLLGTTVKVDGSESDPYAILTVLNMNEHREKQCMKDLISYLLEKSKKDPAFNEKIGSLLKDNSKDHVGLILSERLINMPVQIVPQMYRMLQEEIQWAIDDHEPYEFEWYIILSKTYREVESIVDEDDETLKRKKKKSKAEPTIFYFHPEDEIIEQIADYHLNFKFTKQTSASDSKRAFSDFGISPAMKLFLFQKSKFDQLIQGLEVACKQ